MPPVTSNLALTDHEVKLIERWIEQGAEYKPHWAFLPPQPGPVPAVHDEQWPTNEIDHFVLTRMEENGFEPNPEAEKTHLLRRMSFDLTGLKHTAVQLHRFLAKGSATDYTQMDNEL